MIFAPTNRRIIRPYDKPSFEHTQRYGLIKGHWANTNRVGLWLFNEGSGGQVLDLSGNGNTGTFVSDVSWIRGKFGSALDLVGGDDYITTGAGPGNLLGSVNKNWSVSLWFRAHTPAVNGGLFQIGPLGGDHGKTYVGVIASSIYFRMNGTNYSGNFGFSDTTSWHHLVCTYDGVRAKLYLDNILRIDDAYSTAIDFTNSITALGIFYNLTGGFNGEIDDYLLYNRALTSSEVSQLYREPFLGIEKRTAPVYFFVPTGEVKELAGLIEAQSALTGDVQSVESLAGSVSAVSSLTGNITEADWIGINSSHLDSFCGEEVENTLADALDGTDSWYHDAEETHWFILDLDPDEEGKIYNVQKIRGRSNKSYDPVDVNIYINATGEAPWGDAVASGISTWQDTDAWVEIAAVGKGRYVKVEIVDTESPPFGIEWGCSTALTIFDVYGEFAVELAGTIAAQSGLTGNIETTDIESLAGLVEAAGALTGNIKTIEALADLVACQSALTGNLYGIESLAGLIAAQSTLTGNLVGVLPLSGSVNAVSALTGNLVGVLPLSGLVAAQSDLTGKLFQVYAIMPPEMHAALIDPYSGGAWLWLVAISIPGYSLIRMARNTIDVEYGGVVYPKNNLELGLAPQVADGSVPRYIVKVAHDAAYTLEDKINATKGAGGGTIKVIRIHEDFLDSVILELEQTISILTADSDTTHVIFHLGIPDPLLRKVPLRRYSSKICPLALPGLFKGPECQYAGVDGTCTGKYEDCYTKGHAAFWGAELGLDPNTVRV